MSADVSRSHGGDSGGKGKQKPNFGGRAAGRLNTRDKTQNLSLKEITDAKGPINAGIQQHLRKAYNTNKAAFKAHHWVIHPTTGTYNMEMIRRERPKNITASEWDKYIEFWNDPRNIARAAQNRQNQTKTTVISRQGSRSLARLRDEMRQTSNTQEYPSFIDTFFVAHSVNEEFLRDKDRRIYEEMRRLEAMGTYTDDEINCLARGGMQRGYNAGVGRVLPARATASLTTFSSEIVAGEEIPYERSPATFPQRQVTGESHPQRQVTGESPKLSLGKALNVVIHHITVGRFVMVETNSSVSDWRPLSPLRNAVVTLIISSIDLGILSCSRLIISGFLISCINPEIFMHSGASLTSLHSSLYLLTNSSMDSSFLCLMLWISTRYLMYFSVGGNFSGMLSLSQRSCQWIP
nr:F-box domain, leucine-rich repeat domain, L domain-like protein [Tanacetum cinerariifolium]